MGVPAVFRIVRTAIGANMRIMTQTNPADAERRISRAAIGNPDVSLIGTHVYYKGKQVADYQIYPRTLKSM
jgi:hypothetical protein